jgi:predicted nucleic acid-binding protein
MVSRPHGAVLAWLQADDNANLLLASVSLGEIQAGIEITREQDAAIALVHGLTVVTHNVKAFDGFGVALFNPFEYKGP